MISGSWLILDAIGAPLIAYRVVILLWLFIAWRHHRRQVEIRQTLEMWEAWKIRERITAIQEADRLLSEIVSKSRR